MYKGIPFLFMKKYYSDVLRPPHRSSIFAITQLIVDNGIAATVYADYLPNAGIQFGNDTVLFCNKYFTPQVAPQPSITSM